MLNKKENIKMCEHKYNKEENINYTHEAHITKGKIRG